MLDYIRSLDPIPKHVHRGWLELLRARKTVEQRLGRAATEEEVAFEAGVAIEDYYKLEVAVLGREISAFTDELDAAQSLAPTWGEDVQEALHKALADLPPRDETIMRLLYFEDKNIYEVGEVVGLSGSRVSQIHARTILKLKWALRRFTPAAPMKSVRRLSR